MSDAPKKPTPPSIQDRQKAVVNILQSALISMPRFRPADVALAQEYDALTASILQAALDLARVAAVDRLATSVHFELAKERRDYALAEQKQRDAADAAAREMGGKIAASFVPFPKQGSGA